MNFLKTIIGFCLIYYIPETASETASVSASINDLVDGIVKLVFRVIQLILDLIVSITALLLGPKLDPQKEALILAIDTVIQEIEAAQESPLLTDARKNNLTFIAFLLKVERNLLADNSIPLNIADQTLVIQQLKEAVTEIVGRPPTQICPNTCDGSVQLQLITCGCYTSPEVRQYLNVYFGTFVQISDLVSSFENFTLPQGVSVSTVLNYFNTYRAATIDFYKFIFLTNTLAAYDPIVLATKLNAFIQATEAFNELFGFE